MAHNLDYKNCPIYSIYKKRAEDRFSGQEVLSKEQFDDLSQQPCRYCGKSAPNGIDRVDNTKGYAYDNCVPCCKHCNYVKGDLSQEDFKTWKSRFILKQTIAKEVKRKNNEII